MADVKKNYIFSAEQIVVPDEFPGILKNYIKEVVKNNPETDNLISYSRQYFEQLLTERGYFENLANNEAAEEKQELALLDFITDNKGVFSDSYKVISDYEALKYTEAADVLLVQHLASGIERLVKVYKKQTISNAERHRMRNELATIRQLDHPNVVRLIETFEDANHFYLVLEKVEGETILDYMCENMVKESEGAKIMHQSFAALSYCHEKGIAHGAINWDNVLWDSHNSHIKIIDFGTAQKREERVLVASTAGDEKTAELEKQAKENAKKHDAAMKADIYQLTSMMWHLFFGAPYKKPWSGGDYDRYISNIFSQFELGDEWKGLQVILYRNLHPDLSQRLSAEETASNSWIKEAMDMGSSFDRAFPHMENLQKFRAGSLMK